MLVVRPPSAGRNHCSKSEGRCDELCDRQQLFCWLGIGLVRWRLATAAACMPSRAPSKRPGRSTGCWPRKSSRRKPKLAPRVDDATFLRRVWLDIVGDIPTPEHVTAFLLDPAKDKRERVVRELLDNPQYGQNWARYWRDVILYRKLEDRAAIVANPLVVALTEKFNENEPWDKIAAEFITATGDVRENGATAIHMAQDGRTEETTAEMSRIFLGIQIQCCQCHDHPYDRWKREQFHELAAFFPRIAVRPVQSPTRRSFEVVADDRPDGGRRPNPDAEGRRGQPEHYMPDLDDPAAPGTRMQPKFFLTRPELPFGTPDAERRGTVAKWMTENPWFATAFVNRMWAELVGEGFYEPIDDIGPDRTPSAPKAVEFLSRSFAESGYDVKWLFRAICATEAYQRESRPRRDVGRHAVRRQRRPAAAERSAVQRDSDGASMLTKPSQPLNRRGRPQAMGAVRPECDGPAGVRSGVWLRSERPARNGHQLDPAGAGDDERRADQPGGAGDRRRNGAWPAARRDRRRRAARRRTVLADVVARADGRRARQQR